MKKVEIKDKQTQKKRKADSDFILASDSYAMTLHARLLASGNEDGISCNDCHAPGKDKHAVQSHEDISSSTHKNNLSKTCSVSGCHQFSNKVINSGFTNTDMHDLDYIPVYERVISSETLNLDTNWKIFLVFLIPIIIILITGSVLWSLFAKQKKSVIFSIFGGNHFQKHMIGRKPKAKVKKKKQQQKGGNQ